MACREFQYLYIRGGKLEKIDGNAFAVLPNLTRLSFTNCELKRPPQLNPLKRNLEYLSFNQNSITEFPRDYFQDFLTLKDFVCNSNLLTSIPSFNILASELHNLYLVTNGITDVAGEWRDNETVYERLIDLVLRGNNITSVDARIMKALPNIKFLDLRKNSITHFEDSTRYLLEKFGRYTIALGQTPLDCGSHLAWVVSFQQVVGATCDTPNCVNGMALNEMSKYI